MFAYLGTRTTRERHARGEGISVYRYHAQDGVLERVQLVGDLVNPSYLALNRAGSRLYAVHGDGCEVSAFAVDAESGHLRFLNRVDAQARNPVHLALDAREHTLTLSSHLTGELVVIGLDGDGALGAVAQRVALPGKPGPHRVEQPFSKPHFNPFDPSGRWMLVPDKGLDRVFCFRSEAGRLVPAAQPWVATREGAGPRNLVFHATQPWVFVVNELDSTVLACHFDGDTGALRPHQVLSSLPDTFVGHSRAAGIQVTLDGRTLVASNRGHDSLAVFEISPATGRLALRQVLPSGGRTPRFITFTPDGRWLFALNEDSDTISRFSVAPNGHLTPDGTPLSCGSPVCLVFG